MIHQSLCLAVTKPVYFSQANFKVINNLSHVKNVSILHCNFERPLPYFITIKNKTGCCLSQMACILCSKHIGILEILWDPRTGIFYVVPEVFSGALFTTKFSLNQSRVAQKAKQVTQDGKVPGSIPAWILWDFASKYVDCSKELEKM